MGDHSIAVFCFEGFIAKVHLFSVVAIAGAAMLGQPGGFCLVPGKQAIHCPISMREQGTPLAGMRRAMRTDEKTAPDGRAAATKAERRQVRS